MKLIETRQIDEVGRFVLPMSIRKKCCIDAETKIDICIDCQGQIVLRKSSLHCVICGGTDELKRMRNEHDCVCIHCRIIIKRMDG